MPSVRVRRAHPWLTVSLVLAATGAPAGARAGLWLSVEGPLACENNPDAITQSEEVPLTGLFFLENERVFLVWEDRSAAVEIPLGARSTPFTTLRPYTAQIGDASTTESHRVEGRASARRWGSHLVIGYRFEHKGRWPDGAALTHTEQSSIVVDLTGTAEATCQVVDGFLSRRITRGTSTLEDALCLPAATARCTASERRPY